MNLKKEADLLEQVLSIAETDYAQAYRFLLDAYEKSPAAYGPQTLYFLACLSGGTGLSEAALGWLKKAVLAPKAPSPNIFNGPILKKSLPAPVTLPASTNSFRLSRAVKLLCS